MGIGAKINKNQDVDTSAILDMSKIKESADQLIQDIRREMEDKGINASGRLSSSLEWVVDIDGGKIMLHVIADPYFDYAVKGRGPGKVPGNFKDTLKRWIQDKHIAFNGTIDQFAGGVMYTIRNFGSRRYRDNDYADVLTVPVERFLDRSGDSFKEDVNILSF